MFSRTSLWWLSQYDHGADQGGAQPVPPRAAGKYGKPACSQHSADIAQPFRNPPQLADGCQSLADAVGRLRHGADRARKRIDLLQPRKVQVRALNAAHPGHRFTVRHGDFRRDERRNGEHADPDGSVGAAYACHGVLDPMHVAAAAQDG